MTAPDAPDPGSGVGGRGTSGVVWARREGVLWRRSGDSLVLLVPERDDLVTLSSTGQALWEALAEPADVREMAQRLAALYGVEPGTVAADIEPFLLQLEERHVLGRRAG